MASIAGTSWGAHPDALLTIYRAVLRGAIEYGCLVFRINGNKATFLKLERQQFRAIRIAMGYRISTPISVMLAEAKEVPLRPVLQYVSQIECLEDSAELKDTHKQAEFEETYFQIISQFRDLILANEALTVELTQTHNPINNQLINEQAQTRTNNLRLPKIDLPFFSGSFDEWYSFYNTFQSLIHNNPSITGIQKFHYLKAALKGEAADVIQSLEISTVNYAEAWQMLKNRYDDKRLIIQKHVKTIFELPSLSKENHLKLRQLVDGDLKHLRALKTIGRPIDSWDDVLLHVVTGKLDTTTNKEWENSLTGNDIPTWHMLIEFLEHRCHILEAIDRKTQVQSTVSAQLKNTQSKTAAHISTNKSFCQICRGNHFIFSCEQFLKMSPEARFKYAKEHKLCLNCLRFSSHTAKTCKASSCKTCGKRHNTLLHITQSNNSEDASSSQKGETQTISPSPVVSHAANCLSSTQVLLSTALVNATDCQGVSQTCRALLDSGSQFNFVTEDLVRRLGLSTKSINVPVVGINQSWIHAQEMVKIKISSKRHAFNITINCLLADPTFYQSTDIEMLLGAEVFWSILCISQVKDSPDHPLLQKTLFGWIIGGKWVYTPNNLKAQQCNLSIRHSTANLEDAVAKFWQVDQISNQPSITIEEKECEELFKRTHYRNQENRFVVELPLKQEVLQLLGNSYDIALKRFYSLERKLNKNPQLKGQYTQFMDEYQALDHMRPAISDTQGTNFTYVPHHAVLKPSSSTTKLRVVFDASCKTDSGISLNDTLMVGPLLQQDVFTLLIRFRKWQYALTADIQKMYRQILVYKKHRSLQRILWRSNREANIQVFELNTITYGTACAPYLAIRALQEAAKLHQDKQPLGASRILTDFYVDDLITGANTIQELILIKEEINTILSESGFPLHKWASNHSAIVEESSLDNTLRFDKDFDTSTLGLQWNPREDQFRFFTNLFVLKFRNAQFCQRLWQLKLDWDEAVPLDIHTKWLQYETELPQLNSLRIARRIVMHTDPKEIELHSFRGCE
ncbi:PREDICTED: uncharacterized protein LOC105449476 [Wasmannia auropunctata]|uniref:uncharacterized protein LOC105449476 n=1 Tax=Wasmannia auropunctata TaxID=64793 RepID=UPI0005F0BC38|nr:PREDICTED: uncharacterized protein LOC105449476 [Wasmannia auropunctata]